MTLSCLHQIKDLSESSHASDTIFLCCSALADSPEPTFPFYQALVCYALLWTEKPPGSYQTCKWHSVRVLGKMLFIATIDQLREQYMFLEKRQAARKARRGEDLISLRLEPRSFVCSDLSAMHACLRPEKQCSYMCFVSQLPLTEVNASLSFVTACTQRNIGRAVCASQPEINSLCSSLIHPTLLHLVVNW